MKPLKIIRSEETIRDVTDIHLFIAMNNPAAAGRFLDALLLSFRTLAQWPRFCPVRRFVNYLIFYRVTGKPRRLQIIRVLHGARDVPQVLG